LIGDFGGAGYRLMKFCWMRRNLRH